MKTGRASEKKRMLIKCGLGLLGWWKRGKFVVVLSEIVDGRSRSGGGCEHLVYLASSRA
jgi:hypothetical protein